MVQDLYIIMITAGVVSLLFKMLKQPVVLGYIVAGIIVGPYAFGESYIHDHHNVEAWGNIGVLFVLFSLGLEFSVKNLIKSGKTAIVGAGTIVVGMIVTGFVVGTLMGLNMINALFLGGMLCMSSTTIVVKAIEEAGLGKEKFVKGCMSMLIVEDIIAVVLMVLLSSIAIKNSLDGEELMSKIISLIICLAAWFVCGIVLIPTLMRKVRRHLNDETLVILAIGLCLGLVLTAEEAGFSSALGAFVMGSILAETIEAHRIEHLVTPLKNVFAAIFFVSVGMMIDPEMLLTYWIPIAILCVVVVVGMIVFGSLGSILGGQGLRAALQTGFSLVQIGEFSFIIATLGTTLKVTDPALYPIIVAVSVITTFVTPYIMKAAVPFYNFLYSHMSEETRNKWAKWETRQTASTDDNTSGKGSTVLSNLISKTVLIKAITKQFQKNLYAREAHAEQKRGLGPEIEGWLANNGYLIREYDVPAQSVLVGHCAADFDLANYDAVSLSRIIRSGVNINLPSTNEKFYPNDHLVLIGPKHQLDKLIQLIDTKAENNTNDEAYIDFIQVDDEQNGMTIEESGALENGIKVLSIYRADGTIKEMPEPSAKLYKDDVVFFTGDINRLKVLVD